MDTRQILWQLRDVSKVGYRNKRLDNINYSFETGVTAIIGESGAGKSTLLNILSRMEVEDSGSVDCQIEDSPCPYYIVPQDFGLWPHMTALKHIEQVIPKGSDIKPESLLSSFDLGHKAHEYPEFLSQGECSRLSIARAVATGAKVLIMDEPLVNVDRGRKDRFWNFVLEHLNKIDGSLIFSTHESSEVLAYSENVICMHEGKILAEGLKDEVYLNPDSKSVSKLLGPGNWFNDENIFKIDASFVRPESLNLTEGDSNHEVLATRFFGSHNQTTIVTEGVESCLFHSTSDKVKVGMKVILSLLCLFLLSCSKSTDSIEFSEITSWNIPAAGQKLPGPRAITCGKNEEVIVLDDAGRVLIYDQQGNLKRKWNMPATNLGHPEGVTVFDDGKIAVADTHYARIVVFNEDGTVAFKFGSRGDQPGQFYSPVGITLDQEQNIYVCEYGFNDRIQKFTKDGKFLASFGKSGIEPGNLQRASDMVWINGKLYVADAVNNRVQIFDDTGKFLEIMKSEGKEIPFYLPYDIDLAPDGTLWTIEYANCRLTQTTMNGKILGHFGRAGTELDSFRNPWGLGIDDKGTIYVADTANRRIIVLKK